MPHYRKYYNVAPPTIAKVNFWSVAIIGRLYLLKMAELIELEIKLLDTWEAETVRWDCILWLYDIAMAAIYSGSLESIKWFREY